MNRYTPVWNMMVDSSVWVLPYHVRIVWVTMLAVKDRDHVVRYNAFRLAQRANVSEAEVIDALRVLSEPDRERLEPQEHEGRRIEKVEDGWLVLNGKKYQEMMYKANRREYKRQWAEENRGKAIIGGSGTLEEKLAKEQDGKS